MNTTSKAPWYARLASSAGRPLVLLGALLMSSPSEVSLAETAGYGEGFQYLAPLVLSLYAVCAATVATSRRKGDRGWLSSILGAGMALGFAMGAQIVSHLLAAGYVTSGPWLIAAVSAVPAVSAAHLLHLAVTPKTPAVGVTDKETGTEATEEPENAREEPKAPAPMLRPDKPSKGRSKPSLAAIREAAQNLDVTGQLVTGPAIAKALGVSDRTGARYIKMLTA